MIKLIKNWKELSQVPSNDKYKIIVNEDMCNGWIVPVCDEKDDKDEFICHCEEIETTKDYFDKHIYLSTHTFYGSQYKRSTEILQKCGFEIEIDNLDKEVER